MLWTDSVERTRVRLYDLQQNVLAHEPRTGRLPQRLEDVLPPELVPGFARDAWGNAIAYLRQGEDFVLRAPGPDREAGTPDDILTTRDTVLVAWTSEKRAAAAI